MRRHRNIQQSYAALLNGTSQYFSKTSPTKMDFNGSELVTNGTFDDNVTGWTAVAATLSHETVIKRTGGGSAKMVWASGTAMVLLSTAVSNASTNKFTAEAWVYAPTGNTNFTAAIFIANQVGTAISGITNVVLVADTWTKLVVNATAPGTQTSVQLRVRLDAAASGDILYVDDASLTQAWDFLVITDVKPTVAGSFNEIFSAYNASIRYEFRKSSTEKLQTILYDGSTTPTAQSSGNIVTNAWQRIASTLDRTGSATNYISGAVDGAALITSLGKLSAWSVADVGIHLADPSRWWTGQIGEVLVVRYASLPTDIASWIAYANTQRFIPEPPGGGETVLRIFGRRNDALDQSGNQGLLVNTGGTPIIPK